jgi:uncharacterized OB-fold protein
MLPFCTKCGEFFYPPQPRCARCLDGSVDWRQSCGTGTVWSWAHVRHPFTPGLPVPYVVAEVEMDDQPGLLIDSTLIDVADEQIHLGMPVTVTFLDDEQGFTVHAFRPAEPAGSGNFIDTTAART